MDPEVLRRRLGGPLPATGADPVEVVAALVEGCDPGLVATAGPRYFGFVVGGALPAALAADWLVSAWDQNAGLSPLSPAVAVVEETAGRWLADLFGLPAAVSFGFVTGGQAANTVGLAAARHHVLAAAGWDVADSGLNGAPRIRVLAGAQRHTTIDRALRLLGLGQRAIEAIETDGQGAMDPSRLEAALEPREGPVIVCAQAGNVNTGACDDLAAVCEAAHHAGAWVHVDGAFGLWAAASPHRRHLVAGLEAADSWATDAHKWLNVPYDCGVVFCRHPGDHAAAMTMTASYLQRSDGEMREPADWNPESSRRARSVPVYAALRALGREGVVELVERCCALARRFAGRLDAGGAVVGNQVVLNQVLVSFGSDERTRAVIDGVQRDGTLWAGGTVWNGRAWMRLSLSNWSTTEEDVDRAARAILRVAADVDLTAAPPQA